MKEKGIFHCFSKGHFLCDTERPAEYDQCSKRFLFFPSVLNRRMFPGISVSVWGLEPDTKYTLQVEMVPSGKNRFKYINSKWVPVGKAESHDGCSLVHTHPESPASGRHWMRDRVTFKKIKLTNDKNSKKGYVRLVLAHDNASYSQQLL